MIAPGATFALGLAFAAAACAVPARVDAASQERRWHTVTRVIDGDTIQLDHGERVRLIGVDTPETKHPQKSVEYFGREATQFTKRMVAGKPVRLEYDWQRTDKYSRTLAYVFLEDGTLLNAEIIKRGFGHAYTRFPFKYLDEFRGLEREARENERGLWGSPEAKATPAEPTPEPQARPVPAAGPVDPWSCPASAPIKGNLTTRTGECIYHLPSGQHYGTTKPERCFASEKDAVAGGCRRARR